MFERKYQIFISSTFEDLREERRAVQDIVINSGDFPVQMESFPAADVEQFEFIKKIIDSCDFYVLIIAGRYGSVDGNGMSYTEKEYRYAVEKGIPILVLLHESPQSISLQKSEKTEEGRQRLSEFILEVKNKRLIKTWSTMENLKLAARYTLDSAKLNSNRPGWVRGDNISKLDSVPSIDAMPELSWLTKKTKHNFDEKVEIPVLPSVNSFIRLNIYPNTVYYRDGREKSGSNFCLKTSWSKTFPIFYNNFVHSKSAFEGDVFFSVDINKSCEKFASSLAAFIAGDHCRGFFKISQTQFSRILSYYIEIGLMNADGEKPFTELGETFARRALVVLQASDFELISGEISVHTEEIPF